MGLAIFVTLLPFSGRLTSGSMEWIFVGRPRVAAVMLLAAAGLWLGYAAVNRRLSGTELETTRSRIVTCDGHRSRYSALVEESSAVRTR